MTSLRGAEAGGVLCKGLPVLCLYFCSHGLGQKVIWLCDAFELPFRDRGDAPLLMRKINSAAEFIFAYAEPVMGYVAMYSNDYSSRTAYITLIGVRLPYWRKAVSMPFLEAAVDVALEKEMERIQLEVGADNSGAANFSTRRMDSGIGKRQASGAATWYGTLPTGKNKAVVGYHATVVQKRRGLLG